MTFRVSWGTSLVMITKSDRKFWLWLLFKSINEARGKRLGNPSKILMLPLRNSLVLPFRLHCSWGNLQENTSLWSKVYVRNQRLSIQFGNNEKLTRTNCIRIMNVCITSFTQWLRVTLVEWWHMVSSIFVPFLLNIQYGGNCGGSWKYFGKSVIAYSTYLPFCVNCFDK